MFVNLVYSNKLTLHCYIFKLSKIFYNLLFIILLLFSCCSTLAETVYSDPYNQTLDKLISNDPSNTLVVAKKNLLEAELIGDHLKQLESIYYIISSLNILSETEDVDAYILKGLALANRHNNTRFKSEFIGFGAIRHELIGDFDSALIDSNKALRLAYETNDERLIAENMSLRGQMQLAIENYDLALKGVEDAIEIFKTNDDKENLSINYNLLAIIYSSMGDYDNAIKYYEESDKYDELKSDYNQASLYYNLGATYASKIDFKKAEEYYKLSKELSLKTNDIYSVAFADFGLAEIYMLEKQINEAEKSLQGVFNIFEDNNDILMLFNSNLIMSEIQTLKKDYKLAFAYLEKAEVQSKTLDTPSVHLFYLEQRISYFVAQEEWKQAYELKILTNKVKENVTIKNQEKLLSELKIRFNSQFDQEKLKLLQSQNDLQKDSILQEKTKQKYLWGLIGLTFILFTFTYLAYRNQKDTKTKLYNLSITDYLTQVSNRRHIMEKLKKHHKKSSEQDFSFGVVMIDLDFFKKINDTYGHDIGNEVLIYFANSAKEVMSGIGEVGRIGGEEWLILLPNISFDVIRTKLNVLRRTYKNAISLKIPKDCKLSFSSGVLMNTGQYESHEKLLYDVDSAMYKAKAKGREQDVYISASLL